MRIDKIKKFVSLRDELVEEKASLEACLDQINRALAATEAAPASAARGRRRGGRKPGPKPGRPRGRRRTKNTMTLKEAFLQATKAKPLSKQEALGAIEKLGYKFDAKDPMSSLNTLVYGSKAIKKHADGKFGPA